MPINNTNSKTENKLYLCATPIGNMGDITERVVDKLAKVDVVFCEDTRNTGAMLAKLGIKTKLISCHEHNEEYAAEKMISIIQSGKSAAYVSDAGMPCISDPGERLIRTCIENGISFEVLPGASAGLTAAIMSGLSTKRLYFAGFLPRENKERAELIAEIKRVTATIIIYESPFRVAQSLAELMQLLGNRKAAVVREITKLYEETARGNISELIEKYEENPPKGECVIVIEGSSSEEKPAESLDEMLKKLLDEGMSVKDAAKQASLLLEVPKSEAYKRANEIKGA